MELDLESVKLRLAAAEGQLQSTRLLAGLLAGTSLIIAIVATIVASTRVSKATVDGTGFRAPFRIVDDQGRVLLQVANEQGGPQLRLFDSSQRMVAALGAAEDGGSLSVVGQVGSTATLAAGQNGGHLTVSDGKARPAAWLGVRQEGGQLTCWTRSGRDVLTLMARERGGSVVLTNQQGATRSLGFAGASSDRVVIADGAGLPAGEVLRDRTVGSPSPASEVPGGSARREVTSSVPPQYADGSGPQKTQPKPQEERRVETATAAQPQPAASAGRKIANASTRAGWQRQRVWCQRSHQRGHFPAGGHWHSRWVRRTSTPGQRIASAPRLTVVQARQAAARRKLQLRIASRLIKLARDYRLLFSPVEAEFFYQKALSTYQSALGKNHRLVAGTLQELAGFYRGRGRVADAEKAYRQALASYLGCVGPNHVRVAACQRSLATLYRQNGRYMEAATLFRRALTGYEKVLGPNAAEVLATRQSWAAIDRLIHPTTAPQGGEQTSAPASTPSPSGSSGTPPAAGDVPSTGSTPGRPLLKPDQKEY